MDELIGKMKVPSSISYPELKKLMGQENDYHTDPKDPQFSICDWVYQMMLEGQIPSPSPAKRT